jgi:DNA polymerase-3 subunit epsilon
MKIIVFDTETTGLPTEWNASITQPWKWPHIVQISFILYETETRELLACQDHIIKVGDDVVISKKSQEIHGITPSRCKRRGIDIKIALEDFNEHLRQADIVVAHNVSFDKRMVMVESIRNKLPQYFTIDGHRKPEFCTMKRSTELCKIEVTSRDGSKYFKYPTLTELHRELFDTDPNGVHDSMADVLICLRCYTKCEHEHDTSKESCRALKNLHGLYRI